MKRRSTCAVCHRPIFWAEVYGWLHRKPEHSYQSGPNFSGGQHEAQPPASPPSSPPTP